MADLNLPSIDTVINNLSTDLISSVNTGQTDITKQINPNIRNSLILAVVKSMGAGFDDNYRLVQEAIKEFFPQTTTLYIDRWLGLYGVNKQQATQSSGNITIEGTASTIILAGTTFTTPSGIQYSSDASATVNTSTIGITSITRVGSTATVTTSSNHNLATSISTTLAGSDQSEYNLTTDVIVTGLNTFTYQVVGTPTTPATGTITVSFTAANVSLTSSLSAAASNQDSGIQISLVSPLSGVNPDGFVQFSTISGGRDADTTPQLTARLLDKTSNSAAPFTIQGIPRFIKKNVAGVTRVFPQRATPAAGQATIYFVRDNDADSTIPSSSEAAVVKAAIIAGVPGVDGVLPLEMAEADLIVSPPTAVVMDFSFTTLSPNTDDMQNAITESLTDFFKNNTILETNVRATQYNNIIFSTLDSNGNQPAFALSAPSGDETIGAGEIAILGTISYP